MKFQHIIFCFLLLSLAGCGSFGCSHDATEARHKMVGMTKEQVLVCMGPPKKKATAGSTDVWAYDSSDGSNTSTGAHDKISGVNFSTSHSQKSTCTVNIVMNHDVVAIVHYNGPRGGFMARDEQCGYAVEHCIGND